VSAALLATSILVMSASAGDSRHVIIGSSADGVSPADGVLPTGITISGGEIIPFVLTVKNDGKQTLNNVVLTLGKDGLPSIKEANPQRTVVPALPTFLPTGVTVTASGTDATTAGCDAGGQLLTCTIGTLTAQQTLNINVTIGTDAVTTPTLGRVDIKAVVTVAEIGNDNGANTDTFAAEGFITVRAFSCESVAAYRPGPDRKTVSTCALGVTGNSNFQSASVTIPSKFTQVTLTEQGDACPTGFTCYSSLVTAAVVGDVPSDVIAWTITVNLTDNGLGKPNLQQLVVVHYNDLGDPSPVGGISLAKKNACSPTKLVNCGNAFLTTAPDGDSILNIYVQTEGNGGIRTF
jgi:hypothetical protein